MYIVRLQSLFKDDTITLGNSPRKTVIVEKAMVKPVIPKAQPYCLFFKNQPVSNSAAPAMIGLRPGLTPSPENMSVAKYPEMTNAKTRTTVGSHNFCEMLCAFSKRSSVVFRLRKMAPCKVKSRQGHQPA